MNKTELSKMKKDELVDLALSLDSKAQVSEFTEPTNVEEAINHLMGRVGYVQKSESDQLPYSFASEVAFIKAIRPHMVDLSLTISPVRIRELETIQYLTKKGAQAFNRTFIFTFEWFHAPTNTSKKVTTIGEGTDFGDKSCNKAMTVALKYAMRQSLLIETGDDPDQFNSQDFAGEAVSVAKPRQTKKSNGGQRVDNQWEVEVVDRVMETEYITSRKLARPHLVNILNNSIFRDTLPYGELTPEACLAYVIAWTTSKDKYPDDDTPARAERVNSNWSKISDGFIEEATDILSTTITHPEVFESGLGYD